MKKILAAVMTCLIASGFTVVNQKNKSTASDTTPPVIEVKDSLSVEYDSEFDLNKYINIKDNISKEVTIGVAGSVNTSRTGKYLLTVTATDEAGNMSVKNMTFTVKAKPEPVKEEKKEEQAQQSDSSQSASSDNAATPSYTPSYTPPVSTPACTPPVRNTPQPSESNSQPAGGSTYYEDEDFTSSGGNGGVYGSEETCRAEHSTGQCIPFVGADGSTVQGYIWSN